ncbi:hypothetical protein [Bradyrhizobium liaoningense]|nr:hypothetical protein [Bradyrhizobium liaoningense]
MTIVWTDSLADVDWDELSALYRIAPLGNKAPTDLAQQHVSRLRP